MVDININALWIYTFFLYYFRILFFLIPQNLIPFGNLPPIILGHLTFALTWLFIYLVPPPSNTPIPHSLVHLFLLVISESFLGFILGFFLRIFYTFFLTLGEIITLHTGLAMANLMVPGLGNLGIFGNLFRVLGGLLFLVVGGLEITFYGLKLSFETVPVGSFNPFILDFKFFFLLLGKMISIALGMAMPIITIYILVNLVLALTNRLVPNVNIFFVGYPIYMLANFAVLALLIPGLIYLSNQLMEKYLQSFLTFVRNF